MPPEDLTQAERLVWDAFATGDWVDLRAGDSRADNPSGAATWGPERVVRAEVLRALLLGAQQPEPGAAPGVRLRGARITGRLDLMGATVSSPLVCEYCMFESEIRLVEASTKTIRITHSRLPGVNGTRMRLDGIFNLWASVIGGLVRLDEAKVTGRLCLASADIGARSQDGKAVSAEGVTVDGSLDFSGLVAHGEVSMLTARITGSASLNRARIANPGGRAFGAIAAEIGGWLFGDFLIARGEVTLHNARISAGVVLEGADLSNPGGYALSAGGLVVDGAVLLSKGFRSVGEIRLIGAHLTANLLLTEAHVSNPGGVAVNLDRASIGICQAAGLACTGTFSLVGAHVAGAVDLSGAEIDAGIGERALAGDGAAIDGMLALRRLRAQGELSLRSIRVGREMLMMHAELRNEGHIACRLSGADIAGDLICQHLSVTGGVRLTGGRIGGRLNLEQIRIASGDGLALGARALQASQLLLQPAEPIVGAVDLRHARIEVFRDDPACWPAQLTIDGMTYQALEPRLPARDRLRWLACDPAGPQAQPYEYLAAHYVRIGQPEQARTVWYARERERRKDAAPLLRLWGVVQDVTLGYGYRPWRALAWLTLLLVAGSITFALQPPPAVLSVGAPHFNPVIYTLDLLLPVVDLGLKHAFNPSGFGQWLSYVLIASGWIFVTTVAAAAARVLQRG